MADDRPIILVVLPEPQLAQSVGHFLEQDGWRVDVQSKGKDAIAYFSDRVPHAVIAPMLLSDMPGSKVLKEARFKFGKDLVTLLLAEGQNASALQTDAQASAVVDPTGGMEAIRAALDRFSHVTGVRHAPAPAPPTAADLGAAAATSDLSGAVGAAPGSSDDPWAASGAQAVTTAPDLGAPAAADNPFLKPDEEEPLELDLDTSAATRPRAAATSPPPLAQELPITSSPSPPPSGASLPAPPAGPAPLPDGVRLKFGTLQDMDPARVVGGVLRLSLTGQLIFQSNGQRHTISVEQGVPIFASSTNPENRFGEFLIQNGMLTADQLGTAISSVPPGQKLGEHLVASGMVTQEQIDTSIVAHLQARLVGCFELRTGQFGLNLGPVSPPTRSSTLARPLELLRLGVHNFYQQDELDRLLPRETVLRTVIPTQSLASLARLSDTALALVGRHDGKTSVDQTLADLPSPVHGHQLFYALYAGGALAAVRS